jgi:hypothetical protein
MFKQMSRLGLVAVLAFSVVGDFPPPALPLVK